MSNEQNEQKGTLNRISPGEGAAYCIPDAEGHCITCSDEALPFRVVSVDQEAGLAHVAVADTEDTENTEHTEETTEEIDITLIDHIEAGDMVLVHGGVAIANIANIANLD